MEMALHDHRLGWNSVTWRNCLFHDVRGILRGETACKKDGEAQPRRKNGRAKLDENYHQVA